MLTLSFRLMMAARFGGFADLGYTMTADEVLFWQDMAALLDPLAYELKTGTGTTSTVPASETWYCVNAWQVTGTAGKWFQRSCDYRSAFVMSEGTSLVNSSVTGAQHYLCKPSLVTGSDSRYTTDPRGLYFDRMRQLGTLAQYQIGATATDSATHTASFPTDFTYGMMLQVSCMDIAWLIMRYDANTGLNTLHEVSDAHGYRVAEACIFPFVRATFPDIAVKGVSESAGAGNAWYVKLPGGW